MKKLFVLYSMMFLIYSSTVNAQESKLKQAQKLKQRCEYLLKECEKIKARSINREVKLKQNLLALDSLGIKVKQAQDGVINLSQEQLKSIDANITTLVSWSKKAAKDDSNDKHTVEVYRIETDSMFKVIKKMEASTK